MHLIKKIGGKGTLTIGRELEKVVLSLFSSQYYGETQDDQTEFNIDDGYKTLKKKHYLE